MVRQGTLDRKSRQVTTLKYSYATAQSSVCAVTNVQVPFGRFEGRAGAYHARVFGLTPGSGYSGHQLILSRPYMGRMVIQIVGIVWCGVGALGNVIWDLPFNSLFATGRPACSVAGEAPWDFGWVIRELNLFN